MIDLITNLGQVAPTSNEEEGMEASYKRPFVEDSGDMETFDAPIDVIRDGLSEACVEALKVNTTGDWKKEGFVDVRKKR